MYILDEKTFDNIFRKYNTTKINNDFDIIVSSYCDVCKNTKLRPFYHGQDEDDNHCKGDECSDDGCPYGSECHDISIDGGDYFCEKCKRCYLIHKHGPNSFEKCQFIGFEEVVNLQGVGYELIYHIYDDENVNWCFCIDMGESSVWKCRECNKIIYVSMV